MKEDEIKDLSQKEIDSKSQEEVMADIGTIDWAIDGLKNLSECKQTPYIQKQTKDELGEVLDVLPEEVKVLHLSKDIYASRINKEDKIIRVWNVADLKKYLCELEKKAFSSNTESILDRISELVQES